VALDHWARLSECNPFPRRLSQVILFAAILKITGAFSAVNAPIFNGHALAVVYGTNQVTLEVIDALPGDYNSNGTVDAGDYVVWRKYQGTTHVLPNDPTGGTIGSAQYNQWRANFGKTAPGAGSGSSASAKAAVPEQSALVLLIIAEAGACLRRGRAA
jgi:hypothetical protein